MLAAGEGRGLDGLAALQVDSDDLREAVLTRVAREAP
ncbi:hypothetical protein [Streptomyces sp. NPDC007074]